MELIPALFLLHMVLSRQFRKMLEIFRKMVICSMAGTHHPMDPEQIMAQALLHLLKV